MYRALSKMQNLDEARKRVYATSNIVRTNYVNITSDMLLSRLQSAEVDWLARCRSVDTVRVLMDTGRLQL